MNAKKQTNAYGALKNFLILPVALLIFLTFSCDNKSVTTKAGVSYQMSGGKMTQLSVINPAGDLNDKEPFIVVQQMPQFPGGEDKMMNFIRMNIKYPEKAEKDGIEGTVIVNLVINKKGGITDTQILRNPDKSLTKEVLKIIHRMPNWIPGKQNGENVSVSYALPISFRL